MKSSGLTGCRSYLPLIASFLFVTHEVRGDDDPGIITRPTAAKCPKPITPLLVTAENHRNAYPDGTTYTSETTSLPLKCLSSDFVLLDPVSAKCTNNTWVLPDYTCVALIERERRVTEKIMIITGVVFGVLAASFVIIKVLVYRRGRNKRNKLHGRNAEGMRMGRRRDVLPNGPTGLDRISARGSFVPPHPAIPNGGSQAFANATHSPSFVGEQGPQVQSLDPRYLNHDDRDSHTRRSQYYSHEPHVRLDEFGPGVAHDRQDYRVVSSL